MKRLLTLLLLIWFACASEESESYNNIFNYNGYDSLGGRINTGVLKLIVNDSDISGDWQLTMIGNVENVGSQFGSGSLNGIVTDGNHYLINLNPMIADDNVNLEGILTGDSLNGIWNWSTFIGLTNSGTFTGIR